jgi:predicted ATP-binding protein involved in virulence
MDNDAVIETFIYGSTAENELLQAVQAFRSGSIDLTGKESKEEILSFIKENSNAIPQRITDLVTQKQIAALLDGQPVYLIQDQRLKRNRIARHDGTFKHDGAVRYDGIARYHTIEAIAKELISIIDQKKAEEQDLAHQLESTFLKRLTTRTDVLPKENFDQRFRKLEQKQQQLQSFGIYPGTIEKAEYEGENQRAFSVSIEDYEKKTSIYDEFLAKLNLLLELLKQKYFTNKTISINSQQGYCFSTNDGQPLESTKLSSGEQHELILLHELLFEAQPETLFLIDEPETSLHIAWQKLFIQDLLEIAKLRPVSFLIASHSPQIINGRWDLARDLYIDTQSKSDTAN